MELPPILLVAGKKQHGKDTFARLAQDVLKKYDSQWTIRRLAFADNLKAAAKIIFKLSEEQLYGSEKEISDYRYYKTPREILQLLGTEVVRTIHPDTWVLSLIHQIDEEWDQSACKPRRPLFVITDARFPNEIDLVHAHFGTARAVWIERPDLVSEDGHASETSLDDYNFDYHVRNDAGLVEMTSKIETVLEDYLDAYHKEKSVHV